MANKHLIGRQVFQVEINSSQKAYAVQQQLSEMVWKNLVPELNKLFDSICGEDELMRFDTIELDIGEIDLNEKSTADFVEKIISLLKEKCTRKHLSFKLKDIPGHSKKDNSQKSLGAYYFDLWLYWLEKGTLPSYAIQPEEDWLEKVLETLALDFDATVLLGKTLEKYDFAMDRLILQHSIKDLKSIVELYTGYSQTGLLEFFKELQFLFKKVSVQTEISYRKLEIKLWKAVFRTVILKRRKSDSKTIAKLIINDIPGTLINKISESNLLKTSDYPFLREVFNNKVEINTFKEVENLVDTGDESTPETGLKDKEIVSPQFFKNAGIILVHPFLNHLFKKLDLLEDMAFKNFECQNKAVLLLEYIATGNEHIPEYEMVLPKFLCEMPANIPLDHTLLLTEEEKEEANGLLQAVIEHWGALGTTSIDGVREGFLMREGKLEKEQTGWKLYVEHKTIDVLLDRLPWNLSIVKLPWMKEMLKVEWR
ncbi:contractile injection system tape measure protein [Galbibacter sp. EGI 63066]|uniref:contractile injection system tape measure protein n=1 Tax=Galbibacter sp. EGI 63066 TaxID=2993559 RepID=UPI0022488F2E|nr:contractile injection system tape measure protein [Galbibacter sp. EGI 63066]MCX2680327.1 contractile injection system tape measure protein [Galbibacter sp. EGI 63066]